MRSVWRSGTVVAAFMLAAALSASGTAHALSCAGDFSRRPNTGAVDVPTNALLWGYTRTFARLLGPSGEVVNVDELELVTGWGGLRVLVPGAELQPDSDYTIVIQYDEDSAEPDELVTFHTAFGPATARPPLPTLSSSETGTGSTWLGSPSRYQTLEFDGLVEGQLALLGDIADSGDGDAAAPDTLDSVRVLLAPPNEPLGPVMEWVSDRATLTVGTTDCSTWPAGAADRQDARFGSFDLAGNFSGWIDVPLELPSREEAQAAADQERAERELQQAEAARQNLQEPRSAIADCSTATRLGARSGSVAWLSLSLGLVAAAARRRVRR